MQNMEWIHESWWKVYTNENYWSRPKINNKKTNIIPRPPQPSRPPQKKSCASWKHPHPPPNCNNLNSKKAVPTVKNYRKETTNKTHPQASNHQELEGRDTTHNPRGMHHKQGDKMCTEWSVKIIQKGSQWPKVLQLWRKIYEKQRGLKSSKSSWYWNTHA